MKVIFVMLLAAAEFFAANASGQVVINEIHYDPAIKTDLAEFIELHNPANTTVDLSGWRFTDGVEFAFPAGTTLPAGGYLVVAENPAAFSRKFPGRSALGPWTGLLSNQGETVTLRDAANRAVDEVDYQLGFPWPTAGDLPGYSIELIHPAADNDLGGNWRVSVKGTPSSAASTLVPSGAIWRYRKGTSEASTPATAWRALSFDDSTWAQGAAPVGYDPSVPMGTPLPDMRGNYTSVFLRRKFNVSDPGAIGQLRLEAQYDDGFKVWINGQSVLNASMPSREVAYSELASGSARESADFATFVLPSPGVLRAGENVIAVQLHNISLDNSSDAYIDLRLIAELGSANAGPTPGARNAAYDTNPPPAIRQVEHAPKQPGSGQSVRVTATITDPDGLAAVELRYQVVDPGSYIELNDAAYETSWTTLPMLDDGTGGDQLAGDATYTLTLPGSLQLHRRLIRYRIVANDRAGASVRAPYFDDPQPNFAYFVYDGVPSWQGAARPGVTAVETIPAEEMGRMPAYHLIAKRSSVEDSTWNSRYTGDLYRWWGTLVYDGKVYDHIRYRARGGVWRYAMGKNMWKFDFNRGHDFQARDDFGREYDTKWRKLNLGANIQQGDYQHRGEQGMFESVGFRLFNLAGVESPKTHWAAFRIIDEAAESGATQFNGDFWGLYLAIEQEDGRFLDEHGLPDGNLYKMEGYNGELNNQGRYAATDRSDLSAFTGTFRNSTPSEQWWRQNFDLNKYYSYQAIVQGIHHYDICFGKNYFYFLNPETGKWAVHTWDLDLTWADNMYEPSCGGADEFKDRVTTREPFRTEYKNRVRELRDLLFNTDQAWKVIDEHALIAKGTNAGPNILAADRAMWDYNPVMANSSIVNSSKAGQGRFYQFPLESGNDPSLRGSFDAAVRIMKNYVVRRSAVLDGLASDALIPSRPVITYEGPSGNAINRLIMRSSPYQGSAGFAAIEWRIGEVRDPAPGVRAIFEIEPVWESGEITPFAATIQVPPEALKVGHVYRARVRMKDAAGRWSRWSEPYEFVTGSADNAQELLRSLRVAELMYHPGNDHEYLEIQNTSDSLTLDLAGAAFTDGIDFSFPSGSVLAPGEFALVIRSPEAAFRAHYNLGANVKIFGPYSGSLNNDGETITLKNAVGGAEITSFTFRDRDEWPIAGDGTGHSIVWTSGTNSDYGGNWRASAFIGGTPGRTDSPVASSLLLNEIAAHTDYQNPERPEYDSNDWIEILNAGLGVSLGDYYLSDDAADLRKWRLPNVTLGAGERMTFEEVTHFHNPVPSGFGLNKAGEELYLSHLPSNGEGRVVDAVRFPGQANGRTWARYPDGGAFFAVTAPTRDDANELPAPGLAISEIMYHPSRGLELEEAWQEYLELHNPSGEPAAFASTHGAYRLEGGISFEFPTNQTLSAGGALVLVNFDPANNTERMRFESYYGIQSSNVTLVGPFIGRLGNGRDQIALVAPEAPDIAGEPLVWVQFDEVIYSDEFGADGTGESLTRHSFVQSGNDPANLSAASPTPGWIAGTPAAVQLAASRSGGGITLSFPAQADRTYAIEYRAALSEGAWLVLREVANTSGPVEVIDPATSEARFYRLTIR